MKTPAPLKLLLVLSLALNAAWFLPSKSSPDRTLASADGRSFRRSDLSENAKARLASFEAAEYATLKQDIDRWLEEILLAKEALSRGKTAPELLAEIVKQAPVTAGEVSERLAHSPAADRLPYEQALKEIEKDLQGTRALALKKNFLESLYPRYGVRFDLKAPAGVSEQPAFPARFPVYQPADGSSKGPAEAPVTIEVYSDFLCPFSAKFFRTMEEVEKQYPGKVRTIFRQFPLPMHEGAHLIAEASLCAEEQGKFWEYHDRLMGQPAKRGKPELAGLAQELGLDAPKFQACLDGGGNAAKVDRDIASGKASGVRGTPGYKINGRLGTGAVPFATLKPLIDWCLRPQGAYPGLAKNPAPSAAPPRAGLDPAKVYALSPEWLAKGPAKGPAEAPVTIVEFTDYHCPFCQRGAAAIDGVVEKHKGEVRFISKNFPLPMHPNAKKAAVAASCAAEQGRFWEYRKELFGDSWGKQSAEDLKAAAKTTGLDAKRFDACLDSEKTKGLVEEDMKTAGALGVSGTPTYFINGTPAVGAMPAERFEKMVQDKLAERKK